MKKIIVMLIGLVAFNAFADYGRQGASTAKAFGGGVESGSLEKQFINVINKEGSTISAGMLVVWDVTNDDGASVVIDTAAGGNPACMMVKDCSSNAFCRCQTYGYTDILLFDASVVASAGSKIYMSETNAGYAIAIAPASVNGADSPAGFYYDQASASGASEAFIKLR